MECSRVGTAAAASAVFLPGQTLLGERWKRHDQGAVMPVADPLFEAGRTSSVSSSGLGGDSRIPDQGKDDDTKANVFCRAGRLSLLICERPLRAGTRGCRARETVQSWGLLFLRLRPERTDRGRRNGSGDGVARCQGGRLRRGGAPLGRSLRKTARGSSFFRGTDASPPCRGSWASRSTSSTSRRSPSAAG